MNIKKGDKVVVLSGKDKGRSGVVQEVFPKKEKIIVENLNMVTAHKKARRPGETSEIETKSIPMRVCKVMRICPQCGKPTRTAHTFMESGEKTRLCKKCGESI